MPGTPNDFDRFENRETNDPVVPGRVQELTWALVDEQITDDEFALLDSLLLSDDQAREAYLECMHLHSDLIAHFAARGNQTGSAAATKSPVLGFLGDSATLDLPSAENLK